MATPATAAAAAAVQETEKDMIVKQPGDDDVLLGQGNYRHPGNQKLNKVVDAKVDEYKNQSRVFKTYMAHDIINRMRSKGVRFLKELAPKGWVVVKDDKEAREKVAQRFQYMMRKQDAATKAAAKAKADKNNPKKKAASPPNPSRPNLNWNGITVKIPFLPVFHQLHKSSVMVADDINTISVRLSQCFDVLEMQACFNYEEANAVLTTTENLRMQMNLWKPLGGNRGMIVELTHLEGDAIVFHKYNRYVLEAATGKFEKYQHTLFQSGAMASVQDHVSAFTSTRKAISEETSRPQSPGVMNVKPGMVKELSDRALQENGMVRRPAVKRMEQPKLSHAASRPAPAASRDPKLVPLAPKPPPKFTPVALRPVKRESDPNVATYNTGAQTSFASAFSRWETGVEAADSTMFNHGSGQTDARRASVATGRHSHPYGLHMEESSHTYTRQQESKSGVHPFHVNGGPFPTAIASEHRREAKPFNYDARPSAAPSFVAGTDRNMIISSPAVPSYIASSSAHPLVISNASCANTAEATESREPKGATSTGPLMPLSETTDTAVPMDKGDACVDNDQQGHTDLNAVSNEEMKCDSSVEDNRMDAEMASIDHTTESIKRLSISSAEASYVDPRMSREINVAFGGLWPLSNQEMKCDSSLDDGPSEDGNLLSKQSFIPSSFFGAVAPSTHANPRAHNPPSPAHSFCSHISVEMRSIPSPAPSLNSHVSGEAFSLPSPCNSFNSRCSLEVNSLKHARMDEDFSPSMFQSDQPGAANFDALHINGEGGPQEGASPDSQNVPPTIFVDSSSATARPNV